MTEAEASPCGFRVRFYYLVNVGFSTIGTDLEEGPWLGGWPWGSLGVDYWLGGFC